jgi:hypothetical protein
VSACRVFDRRVRALVTCFFSMQGMHVKRGVGSNAQSRAELIRLNKDGGIPYSISRSSSKMVIIVQLH